MRKFVRYLYETRMNKLYSLLIMSLGALLIFIDGDATFFMFSLFIGIPMFFARKQWIF